MCGRNKEKTREKKQRPHSVSWNGPFLTKKKNCSKEKLNEKKRLQKSGVKLSEPTDKKKRLK